MFCHNWTCQVRQSSAAQAMLRLTQYRLTRIQIRTTALILHMICFKSLVACYSFMLCMQHRAQLVACRYARFVNPVEYQQAFTAADERLCICCLAPIAACSAKKTAVLTGAMDLFCGYVMSAHSAHGFMDQCSSICKCCLCCMLVPSASWLLATGCPLSFRLELSAHCTDLPVNSWPSCSKAPFGAPVAHALVLTYRRFGTHVMTPAHGATRHMHTSHTHMDIECRAGMHAMTCKSLAPLTNAYIECRAECEGKFCTRSSGGALRRALFRLERGVCTMCRLDCHALVDKVR